MSDNETEQRNIEIAELTQVMKTTSGRNTMNRLLQFSGVDNNTFNKDTHEHARSAGRREVGIWLRDELKMACRDNYFLMLKENEDG